MKTQTYTFFIPAFYWDSAALVLMRYMLDTVTPQVKQASKGTANLEAEILTSTDVDSHGVNVTLIFQIKESMPVDVVTAMLSYAFNTEYYMRKRVEASEDKLKAQYAKFDKNKAKATA